MFFLFPVGVDYRTERLPWVTFTMMVVCTLLYIFGASIFISQLAHGDLSNDPLIDEFGLIPNQARFVTWFSYIFLHASLFHLLGNMIYLFLFGTVVEDRMGRVPFLIFFMIGGLAAAAVHIITSGPESAGIPLVGASGSISGCLGAFVILKPQTRVQFRYFFWLVLPFFNGNFTLPSWLVISLWFLKDILGLVVALFDQQSVGGIAFGAHVGGMITGLLIGAGYLALKRSSTNSEEAQSEVHSETTDDDIYLFLNEQQQGPYSKADLQRMLNSGEIGPGTFYWREGMEDWSTLQKLEKP